MNTRHVQRLADIDIAEPGDHPLVEQQGLGRRSPPDELAGQIGGGQVRSERFRAKIDEMRVRPKPSRFGKIK